MGGEIMRRAANGEEFTETVRVSDLRTLHSELAPYRDYCAGCPANRTSQPFGCVGHINYPLSQAAEIWLLSQLPSPEEPLPFLLLTKAEEFGNTGATALALRQNNPGIIFGSAQPFARQYPEMDISSDQLFELFFLLGSPIPLKRMVMLLLYSGAIDRNLEADALLALTPAPPDARQRYPFRLLPSLADDRSVLDLKGFLYALYLAWTLNREMLLDV
ncbi:MAG: hypothetical protein HC915_12165 [Anaerolineae bacterium]|nr:hypothetical protein [Anaerolineae bacterium]